MTPRENLESILRDGYIKADWAGECFFFRGLKDIPVYIELTGALHGRKTFDRVTETSPAMQIRTLPPLVPADTVVLCLKPRYTDNKWYREITLQNRYTEKDAERVQMFDNCRIMHEGNMKFKDNPAIIELANILD